MYRRLFFYKECNKLRLRVKNFDEMILKIYSSFMRHKTMLTSFMCFQHYQESFSRVIRDNLFYNYNISAFYWRKGRIEFLLKIYKSVDLIILISRKVNYINSQYDSISKHVLCMVTSFYTLNCIYNHSLSVFRSLL